MNANLIVAAKDRDEKLSPHPTINRFIKKAIT